MFTSFNARVLGYDLSAAETVALAAKAGFGGVDLLVRNVVEAGEDVAELRALMDGHGLRGGAFPLPVDWRGEASRFESDLERLPLLAATAARLGLTRTCTWVLPETPTRYDDPTAQEAHQRATVAFHVERLGRIARILEAQGIRLGLEVIGVETFRSGCGAPFVTRMADLDRVLGEVWTEAPHLGVLVDAFHLYAAGEDFAAGLAWGVERVVWVHVADLPAGFTGTRGAIRDSERGLPGAHGAVDCRGLLALLATAGYDGPVTAEPMKGCRCLAGLSAAQVAGRVAMALRSVWPQGYV